VKLKGKLPKDDLNGLDTIHQRAIEKPAEKHLVIAVIDSASVAVFPAKEATFEILRIEAVPVEHQETLAALLESIFESRTGKTRLDLGIPDDLDMRTVFSKDKPARTRRGKPAPDIFAEPAAIEGAAKQEEIIDAEVVDDDATPPSTDDLGAALDGDAVAPE
jgi:hypothetical protein